MVPELSGNHILLKHLFRLIDLNKSSQLQISFNSDQYIQLASLESDYLVTVIRKTESITNSQSFTVELRKVRAF
jgi:hypothetical protein